MALRRFIPTISRLRTTQTVHLRSLCETSGSHSDFSAVHKAPTGTVKDRIEGHLQESKVVLYMKGIPSQPACGFSWKTTQILNAMGVEYKAHNVLSDDQLRQGIKDFSAWPTIPQLYINGEFVGGCDIVEGMARNGDLKKLLDESGAVPEGQQ